MANVLWTGLLMFLCKVGSRRRIKYLFDTPEFLQNLNALAESSTERVCDPGTLGYMAERLCPQELSQVRPKMINHLLRNKCLEKSRLFGLYYLIVFDGSGYLSFDYRHCDHCLQATHKGKTYYYHHVIDAKLVTSDGFAFSIDSEFIENENPKASKQDCELKAFYRLAPRIKKAFPRLAICALFDSLYAAKPVFDLLGKFHWKYLIVFKEGSMPAVFDEFERLKKETPQNSRTNAIPNGSQTWHWVNEISYGKHALHVVECLETKLVTTKKRGQEPQTKEETTRWVWISDFRVHERNYLTLGKGGRLRWKIENEGWNMQKNGGYALEHPYSLDETAMKNFYILLQIAHFLSQLMEKGSLLKPFLKQKFGSIRNIALKLLESLRAHGTTPEELQALLTQRYQIRLDTS